MQAPVPVKQTAVRHQVQHKVPFGQIPNTLWEDERLTPAAKALVGYMMSKSEDWQLRSEDIQRVFKVGREAARSMLRCAQEAGWFTRHKSQTEDGEFFSWTVCYQAYPLDPVPPIDVHGYQPSIHRTTGYRTPVRPTPSINTEVPRELHIPDAPRPRRKKRAAPAEDQLRGGWHSDPEDTSDENPVDDLLHDSGLSNGKYVAALIVHYRQRARTLEPIATSNKDAMAAYFMRALKSGTSRQVLLDAIDAFFDQQVYDADRGTLWKQLLDSMPRLAAKKVARAAEAEGDFSSGGALRRRRA